MRSLFSKIAIERLLLDDAVAICQVEPRQDLVLFDSLVEVIRDVASYFFHCKYFLVLDTSTSFDSAVASLLSYKHTTIETRLIEP